MAVCVNCGKWAGVFRNRHDSCDPVAMAVPSAPMQVVNIPAGTIIKGVFWGMWLFAGSAAVAWFVIWMIAKEIV